MSFCPPCWPSKSSSHFDQGEKSVGLRDQPQATWFLISLLLYKASAREPENDISDTLAKPTLAEYAGEGAKGFLDVLESVAGLIPVPGVVAAVKVAKNIIQVCDVSLPILTASRSTS